MFRWFETFIDPYRPVALEQPPNQWVKFFWHFVRQVWPGFTAIVVVGFLAGAIELSLFAFLGQLVDLARASETPDAFFSEHGPHLIWMAVVAMILRPMVFALHAVTINQVIAANFTHLIRWQTHRYVLRQSLNYFQNDFAGRIANKVMQTGGSLRETMVQIVDALWFVFVYTGGAIVLFAQSDVKLIAPLLIWLASYIAAIMYFVPRLKTRSTVMSEARSTLMGRIVDSYTNIMTVKLFAHTHGEDDYARAAIDDLTRKSHSLFRMSTIFESTVTLCSGFLIVGTTGLALYLWAQGAITLGAVALATGLVIRINNMAGWIMWVVTNIFENIGTVQEGMETIAQPIAVTDVPDAKVLTVTRGEVRYDRIAFHYGAMAA